LIRRSARRAVYSAAVDVSTEGREPRRSPFARATRAMLRRRALDEAIDWVRFRFDTFPRSGPLARLSYVSYQPLPWVGIEEGKRAVGSRTRWDAIAGTLDDLGGVRTASDLGAAQGFFTLRMAERGIAAVAVENYPPAYRTALYAIHKARLDNAAVLALGLKPDNIVLLPPTDAVLFLSLWHHFVREHGFETATEMLRRIWDKTGRVLFFDTGENEMPPSFRLPAMEPDAKTWLARYLAETCAGAEVRHLGLHDAFDAEGDPAERNLFAVVRR
jgi:hypothetical protein